MAYSIQKNFVIVVSSRALFNLEEENNIDEDERLRKYKEYQEKNIDIILKKGIAFPFVRRLQIATVAASAILYESARGNQLREIVKGTSKN